MKDIDVLPLTVDLMVTFYRSSRDAVRRARNAAHSHKFIESTGLTIFHQRDAETQATIESVVASFLTVEAAISYVFFQMLEDEHNRTGFDRWFKQKWKGGLSISDKFVLLFHKYSTTDWSKLQDIPSLFQEFVIFRNRIIHPYPEKYHALVERCNLSDEWRIHAVEPHTNTKQKQFHNSGLSEEIARIAYPDAARCYEIMLIVLALLDAQFVIELQLSWYDNPADMSEFSTANPIDLLKALDQRYYPKINPKAFVPEFLAKFEKESS